MTQMDLTTTTATSTRANNDGSAIVRAARSQQVTSSGGAEVAPKFVPFLKEDEAVIQARLLKALADPTRLRILSLLRKHADDICVHEIVEAFTLEQPTISHHLRILRDAGLVDCRKRGLWAYYYVRVETLVRAQEIISNLV